MPLVEGPSNYPKQSKMSCQSLAAPAATGQRQKKKKTFAFIQIGSLIDSKRPDWPLGGEIFFSSPVSRATSLFALFLDP